MKKNNKGFFLVEAIVIISLVTIVMAYVYPNLAKIYDNFERRVKYYDQTEDIYVLKVYQQLMKNPDFEISTYGTLGELQGLMSAPYNSNLNDVSLEDTKYSFINNKYNFKKYLRRLKQLNIDPDAYRLIGVFRNGNIERYASIKLQDIAVILPSEFDILTETRADVSATYAYEFKYLDKTDGLYKDANPNDDGWFNLSSLGNNRNNILYIVIKNLSESNIHSVKISNPDAAGVYSDCNIVDNQAYCEVNKEGIINYEIIFNEKEDEKSGIEVQKDTIPPEIRIDKVYKLFNISHVNNKNSINLRNYNGLEYIKMDGSNSTASFEWTNIYDIHNIEEIYLGTYASGDYKFNKDSINKVEYKVFGSINNLVKSGELTGDSVWSDRFDIISDFSKITFTITCKEGYNCLNLLERYDSGGFNIKSRSEEMNVNDNVRRLYYNCSDSNSGCAASPSVIFEKNDVTTIISEVNKNIYTNDDAGKYIYNVYDIAGNAATPIEVSVPEIIIKE